MNLNRLPGKGHVLMQQAGSDGLAGGISNIVGKTTGTIDDLLDVEKLKQIFPANNTWGYSTLYKRDNLLQLLSEEGIEDCLEIPLEDEVKIINTYKSFCDNQNIDIEKYEAYEAFQLFEIFFQAYLKKFQTSSSQELLHMQNFMIYFIGGGDEQYKNNFSLNLHLDLEKYFGLIDEIIQQFMLYVQHNDIENIKIELGKLKILADLSTMICIASQVDPERKQQIPTICKKIREVREKVQSKLLHFQDAEVLIKGAYFSYAISRDVLNHSHVNFVEVNEGDDQNTIEGKFFEILAEIKSVYQYLQKETFLLNTIGNMSIFIGVFLNKLRENFPNKQINISSSQNVSLFLGFVKNLKSQKIQDQVLKIEQLIQKGQLVPEQILDLISTIFRFIGSQAQGDNVFEVFDQGNEVYIHSALTRLQRKKSSSSVNVDKIEFEVIHNILLYGADFNNEFLVKVLDSLLLLNTFHEYDIEMVRIKIIDIILKRFISKDLLTQESVEKVLRHLEYESKSYRLISVYPRLYLTLAMHFAPRDKIKAYSFYYKAEQMLSCSNIHIHKYGFSYEKFAHILKHTGDDAVESFLLEYNSFVKGYSKVQISDFSDFLEKLKKEKYLNRDVILSYLKNNVFFGICDIDFSDTNTVSERNDCNSKILKLDQNKTLLMVYPKEYEEAFLKLYEGSSEYLKTLYKMAQDALALDDYEIRRLEVLEQAMQENRLVPFYQPKLSTTPRLTTGKCEIVGWEALMRIVTEENGSQVISPLPPINNGDKPEYFNPELYVEAARKKGKVGELTMYMIEKIHTEMKQFWEHNPDKKIMKTAINMDARDLLEDEFYYKFTEFFIQNKKAAKILSFELLENAWTDAEEEMIIHKLIELKQTFKLSFSLDDYGKGGANMVRLQKLLSAKIIQEVKLDPMLITAIGKTGTLIEAQIQTIGVEMIVKQAEAVKAKVTAEKVDSGLLMKLLKNMGVHTVQGFDTSGKPQRTPLVVPALKQEKIGWKERLKLVGEISLTKLKKKI